MIVVVAEKPSVARDIAQVLGAKTRQRGYFEGSGYQVTWAIGHLVSIGEPHELNPQWKTWKLEDLPMLPKHWALKVIDSTQDQFLILKNLLCRQDVNEVVCATDAGREGELIFRYIYEASGCQRPVKRLWISSLTEDAILKGFASLQPSSLYDGLADSARGRNRADWLVGLNLSRLYSLRYQDHLSVGRVQTPTLAMIVEREHQITRFIPEFYNEFVLQLTSERTGSQKIQVKVKIFDPARAYDSDSWRSGNWKNPIRLSEASRWQLSESEVAALKVSCEASQFKVVFIEQKKNKIPPPLLFDLTELQRQANRIFGYTAQKTLDLCQELYERYKLISYPRTDSRYLSQDIAIKLASLMAPLVQRYEAASSCNLQKAPGSRFVKDSGVTDHHAIIPTGVDPVILKPGSDVERLFDLIARRTFMIWADDHVTSISTVLFAATNTQSESVYAWVRGSDIIQDGWKSLERRSGRLIETDHQIASESALPTFKLEQVFSVLEFEHEDKETSPPERMSDAMLLTAMESAGGKLEDKELAQAMKEGGLGTPATRATIIETLIQRGFIERKGKTLAPTRKGIELIATVHDDIKSPALTGEWELLLSRIASGKGSLKQFSRRIEKFVSEVVAKVKDQPILEVSTPSQVNGVTDITEILSQKFGFSGFRPHQKEVCDDVVNGHNVLLVMPTGAGKSLCYQLPGVSRGGATIVISPLIALMEDQVGKLKQLGFRADRIHSGRDRGTSQMVCRAYLAGQLDFLFVAPERLAVPGFVPLLAQRKPRLVAIDEAHCISHWGHDFRPDYRMLQERLAPLQPVTTIALTATATPMVQQDIVRSLGLIEPKLHIHGFRRTNIAIEVVDIAINERLGVIKRYLENPARRPAIIYTPTRKLAEEWAEELGARLAVQPYHAGMPADRRKHVQEDFAEGKLDVIVATTAFGMGIDKADIRTVCHTALPSSLEAYYQEIGRAGRDGGLSRALLLFSFADLKTQEFFLKRNYPDVGELNRIYEAIPPGGILKDGLRNLMDPLTLDNILEKLWVHGGVTIGSDEVVSRGPTASWRDAYLLQRDYKKQQLERVERYAVRTDHCRMLSLMEHFGDDEGIEKSCQICDVCAPTATLVKKNRGLTAEECEQVFEILSYLSEEKRVSSGRMYRHLFEKEGVPRGNFDTLLNTMKVAGYLEIKNLTFRKNDYDVGYQEITLPIGFQFPKATEVEVLMINMTTCGKKSSIPTGKRGFRAKTKTGRISAKGAR